MAQMAWMFPAGKIRNIVSTTTFGVGAVDDDETCPTGKQWWFLSAHAINGGDDARNLTIKAVDLNDRTIDIIKSSGSIGAGGSTAEGSPVPFLILDAGDYIQFEWGACGGWTAGNGTCVTRVLEVAVSQ